MRRVLAGQGALDEQLVVSSPTRLSGLRFKLARPAPIGATRLSVHIESPEGVILEANGPGLAGRTRLNLSWPAGLHLPTHARLIFSYPNPAQTDWELTLIFKDSGQLITGLDLARRLGKTRLNTKELTQLNRAARTAQKALEDSNGRWSRARHTQLISRPEGAYVQRLFLDHYPVRSLEALLLDPRRRFGQDALALSPSDYRLCPSTGVIEPVCALPSGPVDLLAIYTAGYTADDLPAFIQAQLIDKALDHYTRCEKSRQFPAPGPRRGLEGRQFPLGPGRPNFFLGAHDGMC